MYKKQRTDSQRPFKWKHFQGDIILWSVRWYCRYVLSYADMKEIAAERGLSVERSTHCRWVHEYVPQLSAQLKPHLKQTADSWRLDETYIKIKGHWHYLYRAVDKHGNTLDWMLSCHHHKKAAKRFFKKTPSNAHVKMPRVINVDKNAAFPPAHAELQDEGHLSETAQLRRVKYLNNIVENDHKSIKRQSRYRQCYQSFNTAKCTIDGMEMIRMIQKGQLKNIALGDIIAQNNLINRSVSYHGITCL